MVSYAQPMNDKVTVLCPHCQREIPLDDVLTHQIEGKYKHDFDIQLQQEKIKLWKVAQEKAAEKINAEKEVEMKLLKEDLSEKTKKLVEAQSVELNLRKQRVQLEEDKKEFELKLQRQIDSERNKIQENTARKITEEFRLRQAESEKKLQDVLKANEELRRKIEQGSQQTQGEVLELEVEHTLKSEFPYDVIVPVDKGVRGADVIQKVHDTSGRLAGTIIWESKRTKAWSEGWILKLKDDQRSAKAEIAVLISNILAKDIKYFGFKDGIYICDYQSYLGLAKLLRSTLIQLASAKLANVGKKEKMEVLWNYLTSVEFQGRMESVLDSFKTMKQDLEQEKRAYTKIWAKREKQIERVIQNTVGLRGDLEGVMGNALPQIKQLELSSNEELEQIIEKI